jgi:methylphosphotriester-DNA--protein-cysteine methyltransferase
MYKDKDPFKVLESAEKLKKRKYAQRCADQRQASVDGSLGKEAKTVIKVQESQKYDTIENQTMYSQDYIFRIFRRFIGILFENSNREFMY